MQSELNIPREEFKLNATQYAKLLMKLENPSKNFDINLRETNYNFKPAVTPTLRRNF